MGGGLTRRVVLAAAPLVVLIAGAFVVLLLALDSTRDSAALARHSRAELSAANRLETLVIDLETGQRGFVITHEDRFLAPWRAARSAIPGTGGQLLALADDPRQHKRAGADHSRHGVLSPQLLRAVGGSGAPARPLGGKRPDDPPRETARRRSPRALRRLSRRRNATF